MNFLGSQKMQKAYDLGAVVSRAWENGESGDRALMLVEFENANGVFLIDNADCVWGDYTFAEGVEHLLAETFESNPVTRFERDPDGFIRSFND